MKKLRVLVLMHEDLVPPDSIEGMTRLIHDKQEKRQRST